MEDMKIYLDISNAKTIEEVRELVFGRYILIEHKENNLVKIIKVHTEEELVVPTNVCDAYVIMSRAIYQMDTGEEVSEVEFNRALSYYRRGNRTLEEIIEHEKEHRTISGMFGIDECKLAIKREVAHDDVTLFELLGKYYDRALKDSLFNEAMVLACWELINNR